MLRLQRVLSTGVFAVFLMQAAPVLAPYHVLVIEEIFFGSEEAPNAQYVMLRTLASFQVFVNNQQINVQNGAGTAGPNFGTFTALTNPRLDSGVAILMGTAEAEALFGITMDHVTSGRLISPDGRICFGTFNNTPVDCVAYGAYTGSEPGADSPAPAPVSGMALVRVSNTNIDTDDFRVGAPCPQNNAGTRAATCPTPTPTQVPSATPSTTATATLQPPPPVTDYVCPGDCNRDRTVMVNEVVTGVNIVLGSGNVDACLQADANRDGSVRVNELVASVNSILAGCQPMGTRRFSLNPQTSSFTAVLQLGSFPTFGMTGYLDLRAGLPNSQGIAFIDITDTSDYLSVVIPATTAGEDTVVCIRPHKELLPILTAGVIDCDGGTPLGFSTTQDHNVGVVGTCTAGANAGQPCTTGTDCPESECYQAADCATAGGVLEEPGDTHPNVCNGPLEATQLPADSGPGALFIGPDPSGLFQGFPATLTIETALPCGDEDEGMATNFAFTTALSRATIRDLNNTTDATFTHEITGGNLACRDFDQENSAGTLVLDVPTFDLAVPILGVTDIIAEFTLDD